MKVIGSNPDYLLKSFLLYLKVSHAHVCVCTFELIQCPSACQGTSVSQLLPHSNCTKSTITPEIMPHLFDWWLLKFLVLCRHFWLTNPLLLFFKLHGTIHKLRCQTGRKIFLTVAWIWFHHLQWKFKLWAGKFAWGVKAKHCWALFNKLLKTNMLTSPSNVFLYCLK